MKYWKDMTDPNGFAGGEDIPPGALAARALYVVAINTLLEERGAACRVIPVPAGGKKHRCRIAVIESGGFDDSMPLFGPGGSASPKVRPLLRQVLAAGDDAVSKAIADLTAARLDECQETMSFLDNDSLEACLRAARGLGPPLDPQAAKWRLTALKQLWCFLDTPEGRTGMEALRRASASADEGSLSRMVSVLENIVAQMSPAASEATTGG